MFACNTLSKALQTKMDLPTDLADKIMEYREDPVKSMAVKYQKKVVAHLKELFQFMGKKRCKISWYVSVWQDQIDFDEEQEFSDKYCHVLNELMQEERECNGAVCKCGRRAHGNRR